ncbi:MAG: CrcB family protein [Idiomarina sp.]|nr:CrcB family protein [Idiomarina sp.]
MSSLSKDVFSVFFGAILGTYLRVQLSVVVYGHLLQSNQTLAVAMIVTLLVNVLGSFLLGALWAVHQRKGVSGLVWRFWGIGMLGAFTTFSAYALDAFIALQWGLWGVLSVYMIGSIVLSVIACTIGYRTLAAVQRTPVA